MIVPSLSFLVFALVGAGVFNVSSAPWWRSFVLLTLNGLFIAQYTTSTEAVLPYAAFLALGYVGQTVTRNGKARKLFFTLLVVIPATFFWLKRYTFIPSTFFVPFSYLVVGLSYVFFRVLHLLIDSHQGAIEQRVGIVSYLNYTLNFTSLTSGPIQRYQDYHAMEKEPLRFDLQIIGAALERIVLGYFKIAILSALFLFVRDQAIENLFARASIASRVLCGGLILASYPIYLYMNFSGYVDVVIGVARFFRIQLPENFNRPFSSENFITFWSRWHMTLSGWLKTYVYNPIMMTGMARITDRKWAPILTIFAFFVTFFLVGLWHGQTAEFLFFGILQGGGVAGNKLYQVLMQERLGKKQYRALAANPLYIALSRGLTFTWFAFTLLWFWSSWSQIMGFANLLGAGATVLALAAVLAASAILISSIEIARSAALKLTWREVEIVRSRYVRTARATALVSITIVVLLVLDSPAPDVVYKTF